MKIWFFIFTFLLTLNSFGQQPDRDSLIQELKTMEPSEEKLENLLHILNTSQTLEEMENWSLQAVALAQKLEHKEALKRIEYFRGRHYLYHGKEEIGGEILLNLIDELALEKDSTMMTNVYYALGYHYFNHGDMDNGLTFFEECINIYPKSSDRLGRATLLMALGVMHMGVGNFDEALTYQTEALRIKREVGAIAEIPISLNNLAELYIGHGEPEKGLKLLDRSMEICDSLGNKGNYHHAAYLKSKIYLEQGRYELALPLIRPAVDFYEERKWSNNYINSYAVLQDVYARLGRYQDAYEVLLKLNNFKDSTYNAEQQIAGKELALKYESEKKELEIQKERQDKELAQKENQLTQSKQQSRFIIFGLICLFLVVSIYYFYLRYKRQRRDAELIADQKKVIEIRNEEIMDSITYAKRIQTAILPPDSQVKKHLPNSFVLYKPKDVVAGDFYWMEPQQDRILFAAADCTGHGVPGAMVSVICNNGLNRSVREFGLTDPGKILDKTRDLVISEFEKSEEEVKDGMDIALCSLSVAEPAEVSDPSTGSESFSLKYAGAHNPLWIIRNGASEVEEIKATKQPIGRFADAQPFHSQQITINPGDSFYIFSDGFADQFGGDKGKKFKTANFKRLLLSIQNESMERQKEFINQAFEEWRGSLEQVDDVCVIGVRI